MTSTLRVLAVVMIAAAGVLTVTYGRPLPEPAGTVRVPAVTTEPMVPRTSVPVPLPTSHVVTFESATFRLLPKPTVEPIATRRQPVAPPQWLVEMMRRHAPATWSEADMRAWGELLYRESTYRPDAKNPKSTAFGLAQFVEPTSLCTPALASDPVCADTWTLVDCQRTSDPDEQIRCMVKYLELVYGTPTAALNFHSTHGYY